MLKSIPEPDTRLFLILCSFLAVFQLLVPDSARAEKDSNLRGSPIKPGDKVCLYDIASDDPLVDGGSNDSLKYWYRSRLGTQKPRYELRPMARDLVMRVLWPGLIVNGVDERGNNWHKASAVVIEGGDDPGPKAVRITRGSNVLLRENGRSLIVDWQTLNFEKARFKKKGLFGCRRKYPKY